MSDQAWAIFAGGAENAALCKFMLRKMAPGCYGKVTIEIADGKVVLIDDSTRLKMKDLLTKFA